jgi:hypothetical protein
MHHVEQPSAGVITNHRTAVLVITAGILQPQKGVEECFCCALKADAVVLGKIAACLFGISNERRAIEFEMDVHWRHLNYKYLLCKYILKILLQPKQNSPDRSGLLSFLMVSNQYMARLNSSIRALVAVVSQFRR